MEANSPGAPIAWFQQVAYLQDGREFKVVALGVQSDIHRTSRHFIPAILSSRSHRGIAHDRRRTRQLRDLVDAVDGQCGRADRV